jgi:PAS domain-containing protein
MLLVSIALELTLLLTFWLALSALQKEGATPGRRTFLALSAAAILWNLGELLTLRGGASPYVADHIRYAGILSLPPLWLGFAAHVSRVTLARRVPWFPLVLLAPGICAFALLFSPRWAALFVVSVPNAPDRLGPLGWVMSAYDYALVLMATAVLLASALRWDVPGRWTRRIAVGLAPLVPLAGNAFYLWAGLSPRLDPTPLLFNVALVALHAAITSGGLLQALPVSQHDLIDQLPLGVILTDRSGVVISMNPAAERHVGMPEARAIGRSVDAVLSEASEDVHAEVSPVRSGEREAGQLVLIDPPGKAR